MNIKIRAVIDFSRKSNVFISVTVTTKYGRKRKLPKGLMTLIISFIEKEEIKNGTIREIRNRKIKN